MWERLEEAAKLIGAALVGEPILNDRLSDFTDTSRIHHAQIGVALLVAGYAREIKDWLTD